MKKTLVFLTILAVAAGAFAGPANEDQAGQVAASGVSAPGVFPIVDDVVDLVVFTPQDVAVSDYEDNAFTQYMEETTNVHVIWNLVSGQELRQKLNLMLASQADLPDVYLGTNINGAMTNTLTVKYGSEGGFLALNDLIAEHGFEFKRILDEVPLVEQVLTAPDGNIYSLPKISECYNCETSVKLWMNTTFLDSVGMEMPTTTEELYDVLVAFRDMDPNGNGIADEIPLAGATNGWNQQPDAFLMNSFVYYNRGNPYYLDSNEVVAPFVTEQWRDGLRYMNRLIEDGLLDPVSFTQDRTQLRQLVEEETMRVGAVTSGGFHVFTNPNNTRKTEYSMVSPLEGPSGVRRAWYNPYWAIGTGAFVISSTTEIPEVAYKWADHFFNLDVTARGRLGIPGVDWVDAQPGELGSLGEPAVTKAILRWGSVQNSHWQFRQPGYWPAVNTTGQAVPDDDPYPLQLVLDSGSQEFMMPFADPSLQLPPLQYTASESEEIADYGSTILTYVRESLARFVVGDLDLDSDWDSYLGEFEKMNLDRVLDIMQTAYDRQWQ